MKKCTEIGVTRIVPVITERMEPHADRRLNGGRLTRIAQSAAKQAGRSRIPVVEAPLTVDEALAMTDGPMFVAAQHADVTVAAALGTFPGVSAVACLIGPEGDFTDGEYVRMEEAGVIPVSLGGLTFRAETAAIAAAILFVRAAAERKE